MEMIAFDDVLDMWYVHDITRFNITVSMQC